MAKYEAGFIGAGNMGGALALAAAKKTGGDRIAVACSTRERSEAAAQRLGCTAWSRASRQIFWPPRASSSPCSRA